MKKTAVLFVVVTTLVFAGIFTGCSSNEAGSSSQSSSSGKIDSSVQSSSSVKVDNSINIISLSAESNASRTAE